MKATSGSAPTETASSGTKYPYITGHCGNGAHEGKKVISALGHLLRSCSGYYTWRFTKAKCTCWCHAAAAMARRDAQIAAATSTAAATTPPPDGMPDLEAVLGAAIAPARPVVVPPEAELKVVTPDPIKALETLCNSGRVSQQLVNLVVRKILFQEPTEEQLAVAEGRRKRGELEDNVEVVCRLWLAKCLPWNQLTTDAIALMIDANELPSQGAIYSVLMRWASHNWATVERGPVRFVSFSDDAYSYGLAELRRRSKREAGRRSKGFF